jgi:hypothetical protein
VVLLASARTRFKMPPASAGGASGTPTLNGIRGDDLFFHDAVLLRRTRPASLNAAAAAGSSATADDHAARADPRRQGAARDCSRPGRFDAGASPSRQLRRRARRCCAWAA